MSRKKLKLVHYKLVEDNRKAVLLIFNRDLHPLEAMGIVHLVSTDIERSDQP